MPPVEIAFLALVCVSFLLFAIIVAFVTWYSRPRDGSAKERVKVEKASLDVSPPRAAAH